MNPEQFNDHYAPTQKPGWGRRVREPSTWAGIGALVALFYPAAAEVVPLVREAAVAAVVAIPALVGIFLPEKR
jgi:hypothetical protein